MTDTTQLLWIGVPPPAQKADYRDKHLRLLAILDEIAADVERLDKEADFLAMRLAASPASCPADSFCVGKVRPGCADLDDAAKCRRCYREEARRAVEHFQGTATAVSA